MSAAPGGGRLDPSGRPWRWGVALGMLALVLTHHFHGHEAVINGLNTAEVFEAPPTPAPPPLAEPVGRLWVVMIDGLRFDRVAQMPTLRRLASEGASRPLMADFPTFTFPMTVAMATGMDPIFSGVRLNGPLPAVSWDSAFKRAAAAGFEVRVSPGGFEELPTLLQLPEDAHLIDVEEVCQVGPRALSWIYFGGVDEAGHWHGADAPEYAQAAQEADALVARVEACLEPGRDALLVVSDHGHLPRGGHGGVEEVVRRGTFVGWGGPMAGRGLLGEASMREVAPTMTSLLGLEPPTQAMGRAMGDALGLKVASGPTPGERFEEALTVAFEAGAWRRLAWAGGVCALWLMALALAHRRGLGLRWRDGRPTLIYALGFALGAWALGYGWSWSLPRGGDMFILETAALGVLVGLLSVWRADPRRRTQEALVMLTASALPYVLVGAWVGLDHRHLAGPLAVATLLILANHPFYGCLVLGLRALRAPPSVELEKS